jgi:predicted nucleotidyltransferase component of viral defense system
LATLIQTLQNVLDSKDPLLAVETKRILLKEVLQVYVLDYLYNHPAYRRLYFYGGTCLHVIFGLNRLSEDLDFDNQSAMELNQLAQDLVQYFQRGFIYPEASAKTQRAQGSILRVTLKFPVLNALGLSPLRDAALHLKVEVSHHSQVAVIRHTPVLSHGRSLVAAHFSLETMLAGKILACLERSFARGRSGVYVKGRDFYDLLWFMQQGVQPLEQKLAQDGQQPYTTQSAFLALREKIALIKTRDLAVDLLPLFESPPFIEAWLDTFHETYQDLERKYLKT